MLHAIAIGIHVVVAVLAIGLVGAIPLTARFAQRAAGEPAASARLLGALLRALQLGMLLMLLSGVALDYSVAGGYHRMRWFQLSMLVLVFLGFSAARVRAALRDNGLRRVEQWGWAMCASVAVITLLMQLKQLP